MSRKLAPQPTPAQTARQEWFTLLALTLFITGLILGEFRSFWKDLWISSDFAQIRATITAEKSHGAYDYEYQLDDHTYVGSGQRGRNLPFGVQVGQQVLV